MSLKEIYKSENTLSTGVFKEKMPIISFEIFPPKNDETGEKLDKLINNLSKLKKYNPALISLTYGAGGTTQSSSFNIIKRIQTELGLNVMPHFTCVGATKKQIHNYLIEIESIGIKNILALRGDIPQGMELNDFEFKYAKELVDFIKSETDLSIGVAGYPECHIECDNLDLDIEYLKKKVDAGADAIYTQLFFDNSKFFNFVNMVKDAGIDIPIITGILPVTSYSQLERMLSMAKVTLPEEFNSQLEKYKDSPEDIKRIGISHAINQCKELIESGVQGLHFYTLNSAWATSEILDNLLISV